MENNFSDPQQQLDDLARARASAADRMAAPVWYHPMMGALMGTYLLGLELWDGRFTALASAVFVLAIVALTEGYQQATGIRFTGLRSPASWTWAALLGATLVVAVIVVKLIGTANLGGPEWVVLVSAVALVLAVASTWISRRAEAAMIAEQGGTR